jgi:hypothetical protein
MRAIHSIICGATLTGKTTLAHFIAQHVHKNEHVKNYLGFPTAPTILVYDPVRTKTAAFDWPVGSIVFQRKENFIAYLANFRGRAWIFIDEADNVFSHAQPENNWILTKGRHFGFTVFLITQRPKMVSPSARSQCGICYCFRLARDDLKAVAADFAFSDVHEINLDRGDYLVLESGLSTYSRHNIFNVLKGKDRWSPT